MLMEVYLEVGVEVREFQMTGIEGKGFVLGEGRQAFVF